MSSRIRPLLVAAVALGLVGAHAAVANDEDRLERYASALSQHLDANPRSVLEKIPHPARKLLAARAYLRAGDNLRERWSWTDAQIRDYEKSAEYRQLLTEIDAIVAEFERRNPGHTLYANTQVRSLDTQIERWNSNPRVGATAANLYRDARRALESLPRQPTKAAIGQYVAYLKSWRPSPTAPLAAPGLSLHGQSRAIDFQIMRGGKIVAATELNAVPREWDAPGWTRRLEEAVTVASKHFKGPLAAPNEPWHYEYDNAK